MSKSHFYVASGFKEDCIKLLSQFHETNSIRFEKFCQVWKDMKFAMIYAGRQTYSELLEFCEEVLHIAKEFVLPPREFKERIGGLYLLYGLYYKMPVKDMIRIRITKDQWSSLMELHEQLKAGEHLDANFILCTMIHDEVFENTIFDFEWGLEKFYREKQTPVNTLSTLPALQEMTQEGNILPEIDKLAKEYRQATSAIGNTSLTLFNENFIEGILFDIRKLETNSYVARSSVAAETYNLRSEQRRRRDVDKQKDSKVRSRIGDGFDMDTSEEEDEDEDEFEPLENYDPNLAENFDDDVEMLPDAKRLKFAEVTLPGPNVKLEDGEASSD